MEMLSRKLGRTHSMPNSEEAIFYGRAAASIIASANLLLSDCSIGALEVS
jgi:hypothetical protein